MDVSKYKNQFKRGSVSSRISQSSAANLGSICHDENTTTTVTSTGIVHVPTTPLKSRQQPRVDTPFSSKTPGCSEFKSQLFEAKKLKAEMKAAGNTLETQLQAFVEVRSNWGQLNVIKDSIEKINTKMVENDNKADAFSINLSTYKTEHADARREGEDLVDKLETLKDLEQNLSQESASIQKQIDSLLSRQAQINEALDNTNQKRIAVANQLEATSQYHEKLEKDIELTSGGLEECKKKSDILESQLAEVTLQVKASSLVELKNELFEIGLEMKNLQRKVDDTRSSYTRLKPSFFQAKEALIRLRDKLGIHNFDLSDLGDDDSRDPFLGPLGCTVVASDETIENALLEDDWIFDPAKAEEEEMGPFTSDQEEIYSYRGSVEDCAKMLKFTSENIFDIPSKQFPTELLQLLSHNPNFHEASSKLPMRIREVEGAPCGSFFEYDPYLFENEMVYRFYLGQIFGFVPLPESKLELNDYVRDVKTFQSSQEQESQFTKQNDGSIKENKDPNSEANAHSRGRKDTTITKSNDAVDESLLLEDAGIGIVNTVSLTSTNDNVNTSSSELPLLGNEHEIAGGQETLTQEEPHEIVDEKLKTKIDECIADITLLEVFGGNLVSQESLTIGGQQFPGQAKVRDLFKCGGKTVLDKFFSEQPREVCARALDLDKKITKFSKTDISKRIELVEQAIFKNSNFDEVKGRITLRMSEDRTPKPIGFLKYKSGKNALGKWKAYIASIFGVRYVCRVKAS